jgi:aryl-alcohol dehydrogenase-like predicted oxidoreductase
MEFRRLLGCGLKVPALSFGTATFGGQGDFFKQWGSTDLKEAKRLIDLCLDNGINFFDTANGYSRGMSEEILGAVIKEKRNEILLATKSTFPMGDGPNEYGSSRYSVIKECNDSLKRMKTDHIDVYYMHGFDALTPIDETLRALDDLVTAGKIRYIGCSNFSGWQLMKSLSISEKYGWSKYVIQQSYYSLVGREFEWELMPLGIDQKISTVVWSPLAGGALSGKITRKTPAAPGTRSASMDFVVSSKSEHLHNIVDVLHEVSNECEKSVPQIVLNWCLQRPTVSSVIIGARNEEQLKQNIGAVGWKLTAEQVAKLDRVSEVKPAYPYWHQNMFPQLGHPIR